MPTKYVHTEVEGQKLKLSNLDKVIYPDASITKAEIIQYYLDVAPLYLTYSKNRPTTLIRYPDGIKKASFYAKSAPEWTPDWIRTVKIQHSSEAINYIVPEQKASMAWLANLSALELHPAQMEWNDLESPDHFIFDLDPDPNQSFEEIKQIAFEIQSFLACFEYTSFVKTSGSKGIHIYVPIIKNCTHQQMTEAVKSIAQEFVKLHPQKCTLHIQKQKRAGKILLDIYRNHKAQTTIAPYSLRAKANAPISMPISWEELEDLESSQAFNIKNYKEHLNSKADPWIHWESKRVQLHTLKKKPEKLDADKVPESLSAYFNKREFDKTTEPKAVEDHSDQNRFVVQIHDATNLHYDLRLEREGVLLSWAIPKGIPVREGEKRMAIQTEAHPLKYLDFEGSIPKGAYGAGEMWVFDRGKFEMIKYTSKSIKFRLSGKKIKGQFSLYNTSDNQWLLERKDTFCNFSEIKVSHMLAGSTEKLLTSKNYSYEIKWDGIRVFIIKDGEEIRILSRSGRVISNSFPEVIESVKKNIKYLRGVFDGELVCVDDQGKPIFASIISRMHKKGDRMIELAAKSNPSILYLFDITNLDGIDITNSPLQKRQEWLKAGVKTSNVVRLSEVMDDGASLLKAAESLGLEGIMIKDKSSSYAYGSRTKGWLKLKFRNTISCYIIGYTEGKGDRSHLFGSLHLLEVKEGEEIYRGRVGSGFNADKMKLLLAELEELRVDQKPINQKVDEELRTQWVKPQLMCEIQYASITANKTLREPIFLHLREDLASK